MLGRRRGNKSRVERLVKPCMEALESRTLLSGTALPTMHTNTVFAHVFDQSGAIPGFTPSQIRHAYGFDLISQNGAGQTIAISDAFNAPNIKSDLATFDAQFNLPAPPSFQVVSQTGSPTNLPQTDADWAGEISLDVEWAHAMAPAANILLVEANSPSTDDLLATVDFARSQPNVSVISMSWGGSEFFNFASGGNTLITQNFVTPSGHQGVTFVASSGDSGAAGGVNWPAIVPTVLSVGGTSLFVNDQNGTYSREESWSGSSGGYSSVLPEPTFQDGAQATGARSNPDVAYDGDSLTGFAVYDSTPVQGQVGWQEVGGTSAGAPQWAALIALADQARVAAGQGTLDGATQTLPMLYSVYSAPGTPGYSSTYTQVFNDVADPTGFFGGQWAWQWGGIGVGQQATPGYDTATGLGTPYIPNVIQLLSGGPLSARPTSTGTTGPIITPPATVKLNAVIMNGQPTAALTGQQGKLKIKIINTDLVPFNGPVSIALYISPDGTISPTDTPFTTLSVPKLQLRASGSKILNLKFNYPTSRSAIGTYYVLASVGAPGTGTNPAQTFTPDRVSVSPPRIDLGVSFKEPVVDVTPGKKTSATVTIQNLGNVNAVGTVTVNLYASASGLLDSAAQLLVGLPARKIHLKPGKSMRVHVRFVAPPNLAPSTYKVLASISSSTTPSDANASNDIATITAA